MKIRNFVHVCRLYPSVLFGHVRRLRRTVIASWDGSDPNRASASWAVYSHYNRRGRVSNAVLYALRALKDAGFRVVFVSNSKRFDIAQLPLLTPICAKTIIRRNAGYDFGAYRDGIAAIPDTVPLKGLILMNDSVYGPLFPLQDVLRRMSGEDVDVWGLTDSWSGAYHVQSYFIYFTRNLLASSDFRRFWRTMPLINYKRGVVDWLEIGLSQFFLACNYRVRALFPYHSLVDRYLILQQTPETQDRSMSEAERRARDRVFSLVSTGRPLNPTHYFWNVLINEFQHPLIKRELLLKNPDAIHGVDRWPQTIAASSRYDRNLIFEDLKHSDRLDWHRSRFSIAIKAWPRRRKAGMSGGKFHPDA